MPTFSNAPAATYCRKLVKLTKQALTARISEKTGLSAYASRKALKSTLWLIQRALCDGKKVDLGKIGKLAVVSRKPMRRINKNLKHRSPTIEEVYRRYPKTVRLLGAKDLSENPLPTIVHKKTEPMVVPTVRRRAVVAFPSWRRRIR